jgi:hypothetical protein
LVIEKGAVTAGKIFNEILIAAQRQAAMTSGNNAVVNEQINVGVATDNPLAVGHKTPLCAGRDESEFYPVGGRTANQRRG